MNSAPDANEVENMRNSESFAMAPLRLEMIAEDVETKEQFRYLTSHGCFNIQAYNFSRPKPTDDFKNFRFKPTSLPLP